MPHVTVTARLAHTRTGPCPVPAQEQREYYTLEPNVDTKWRDRRRPRRRRGQEEERRREEGEEAAGWRKAESGADQVNQALCSVRLEREMGTREAPGLRADILNASHQEIRLSLGDARRRKASRTAILVGGQDFLWAPSSHCIGHGRALHRSLSYCASLTLCPTPKPPRA